MAELQDEIAGSATAFAEISSRAAAAANVNRLRAAERSITAGQTQIDLERSTQRREIARNLAQFQGQQAAARAFRGTGGGDVGTGAAVSDAATAQSADQAAIVEANAAAKEVALIVANQPQLEDPVMAAIQGGVQGINFGTQIAQALLDEAELATTMQSYGAGYGPGGIQVFSNNIGYNLNIPGLDLTELFGGSGLFD